MNSERKIFDFAGVSRVQVVDEFNFVAKIFYEPHVMFFIVEEHLRRRSALISPRRSRTKCIERVRQFYSPRKQIFCDVLC